MALGQDIGTLAGDVTGIPGAGEVGGLIGGGIDLIGAAAKRRKALSELPPETDPLQLARLSQLNLQRRQLMTGTAFNSAIGANNQNLAATNNGILQASGGAGGAAIAGMARASQAAGANYNEILSHGLSQENETDQLYGTLLNSIAQRRLGIQGARYNQAMTDATQSVQDAQAGFAGGVARGAGTAFRGLFNQPTAQANLGVGGVASAPYWKALPPATDLSGAAYDDVNAPAINTPPPMDSDGETANV